MKLNRKWLLVIALVLSMTTAISGTLAYLTDRDSVTNTFTMGNVDIEVEEEFEPDSPLYPGVEVDKEAGIVNKHATEPAYVWMVVSVPSDLAKYIELGWADGYTPVTDGVTSPHDGYTGYLVKYPEALDAGDETGNMLESVKLAANVDYQGNEYVVIENGQPVARLGDLSDVKIMVDGFAIQTEGFDDVDAAYTAYTTQWGGLTGGESNAPAGTAVATAAELAAELAKGGEVYLTADIDLSDTTIEIADGTVAKLNLNGKEITAEKSGAASTSAFSIKKGGSLTVTGNGKVNYTAEVTANASGDKNASNSIFNNQGTLTIDGGSYHVTDKSTKAEAGKLNYIICAVVDNFCAAGVEEAKLTINGGEFSISGLGSNLIRNYPQQGGIATLTINGGTFRAKEGATNTYIWNQDGSGKGYMNFLGGTYEDGVVYEDYKGQDDITIADGVTIKGYSGNN
ncbi:MAG: SipW-dependent-type signal peptide-containing protein [Clostridia bacterium]|nr:SipW-dependent-type signal peptide-containing protein [Clostridia bacterium]